MEDAYVRFGPNLLRIQAWRAGLLPQRAAHEDSTSPAELYARAVPTLLRWKDRRNARGQGSVREPLARVLGGVGGYKYAPVASKPPQRAQKPRHECQGSAVRFKKY